VDVQVGDQAPLPSFRFTQASAASSAAAVQNCTAAAHEVVSCRGEAEGVRSYYPDPMCMSQLSITCPASPGGAFLLAALAALAFCSNVYSAALQKGLFDDRARLLHPRTARSFTWPRQHMTGPLLAGRARLRRFASFG